MTATSLDPLPARLRQRRAVGYEPRFLSDELEVAPEDVSVFGAEGGLWSCVEDLGRWLSCQLADEPGVVDKKTLPEMHKPRYLVDDAWTQGWCIGWYARRRDDVVWIMHSGGLLRIHHECVLRAGGEGRRHRARQRNRERDGARDGSRHYRPGRSARVRFGDRGSGTAPRDMALLCGPLHGAALRHVVRVEWLDGKLTVLDADAPTWKPTLAPTDDPNEFTIEARFRESGELARFERAADGRVVSLFLAVARLQRLEPASDAR